MIVSKFTGFYIFQNKPEMVIKFKSSFLFFHDSVCNTNDYIKHVIVIMKIKKIYYTASAHKRLHIFWV